MDNLNLINRTHMLFVEDVLKHESNLRDVIEGSKFLVIGAAGTIGQAVVREIFARDPKTLHAIDISENNLVELVRDIRSSEGYRSGDFRTFSIDCSSLEFEMLLQSEGPYDYIFNLSALKHVRSEKDPYSLMRLTEVNILNTVKILDLTKNMNVDKYFCVSTDKAANPVNMMGASKRIMELFLTHYSDRQNVSMARFANVAFSDGSLLHGFNQRLMKGQPLSAPKDIKRYFVTPKESGQLCLLSGLLGGNKDIFFPKLNDKLHLVTFADIAKKYLKYRGFEPYECGSEQEARDKSRSLSGSNKWPCYFFETDTTGEKDFEEFYTKEERLDFQSFNDIGIVKSQLTYSEDSLFSFIEKIECLKRSLNWSKEDILEVYKSLLPNFLHRETGKYLEQKM